MKILLKCHCLAVAMAITTLVCQPALGVDDEGDEDDEPEIVTLKFSKKLKNYNLYCGEEHYQIGKKRVTVDDNDSDRCEVRLWSDEGILVDQFTGWFDSDVAAYLDPNSLKFSFEMGRTGVTGSRLNDLLTSNRMDYVRLRAVDANSRIGLAGGFDLKMSEKKEKDLFESSFGVSTFHVGLQLRQSAKGIFDSDFFSKLHGSLEMGVAIGEVWYELSDAKNKIESQGLYLGAYGEFSLEYPLGRDFWVSYSGAAETGIGSLKTVDFDVIKSEIPLTLMSYTVGVGYGI